MEPNKLLPMMVPSSQASSLYDDVSMTGYTTSGFTLLEGEINYIDDVDDEDLAIKRLPEHACR